MSEPKYNIHKEHKEEITKLADEMFYKFQAYAMKNGVDALMEECYKIADNFLKKVNEEKTITCKKGCSFCCHDEIHMSDIEARYFDKNVVPKANPNKMVLATQQNSIFKTLPWKSKRCALLTKEGECSVYENRPLVCRVMNSNEKAELCKIDGKGKSHGQFFDLSVEAMQIALIMLSKGKVRKLHKVL